METRLVLVAPRPTRIGDGFLRHTNWNSRFRLMREQLGLYRSYLRFSSPHQRSLHHPVSLSFLAVSVLASSSITHPHPEGLLESKPFCGCCFLKPIRTLPRPTSPSTWSAASSVLPDTYLSSSPSPQTFDETPTLARPAASSTAI